MKIRLPWMSRTDRARWRCARTLNDLGRLTAHWWEGTVRSLPGYPARRGPSPELAPHTRVLATANRAGFLTIAAQTGTDGKQLRRKAAVQGFASDPVLIRRLVDAAEKAGLDLVLNDHLDAERGPGDGITVTSTNHGDGNDVVFGYALGIPNLRAMWPRLPHALEAVAPALQITLADPHFGPSTLLWDTLAAATIPAPPAPAPTILCQQCGCTHREECGDGCTGVTDQADGRCAACIDPGVLIDWSKELVDPRECVLCGAPFYALGDYCSVDCEIADAPGSEDDSETTPRASERPAQDPADDPWSTSPF